MLPIGPLMIEHRLIERMIKAIGKEIDRIEAEEKVDPVLIDAIVDFIRTYADRCHHGKEEDILFRELKKKPLSEEHERTMNELIEDHRWARQTTGRVVEGKNAYAEQKEKSVYAVTKPLRELIEFYPKHIEKEDKRFFIPIMEYFSKEEKDALLKEGDQFDKTLIHEKYAKVVDQAEQGFKIK